VSQNKGLIRSILAGELDSRFVKLYLAANWVLMSLIIVVATMVSSLEMAFGILVGGVIANLNFVGLDRDCRRVVRWHSMAAYFGGMAVRMALIALAVTVVLLVFPRTVSPVGLFIGLSVGVINFYVLVLAMVIHRVRLKEEAV